jgi:hypothetical protein
MKSPSETITIKELAAALKINPMTVRRCEDKWKLYKALVGGYDSKPRLYDKEKAVRLLKAAGVKFVTPGVTF